MVKRISTLLKKRLDSKEEMEQTWNEWAYNGKKGCPPPNPYIMDWKQMEFNYKMQKSGEYMGVVLTISLFIMLLCLGFILVR